MHGSPNPNDTPSLVGIDATVKTALAGWKATRALLSDTVQSYLSACATLRTVCTSPSHRTLERASVEEALVTVDSELDPLATESNALRAMQISLATMRNKSATLARVNALPPEVLADIFVRSRSYCVRNNDFSFCDIAHVCAYWREIALDTVDLWTHIDVGPDTPSGMTRLLLGRTKASPAHIHVYEPEPPNSNLTSDYEVGKAIKMLEPYIHHVCALDIESHSYSRNFVGAVLNLWLDRGSRTLPKFLRVSRPSGDQTLSPDGVTRNGTLNSRSENAEGVLSSLNTLHLHGVHFDWDSGAYRGLVDLRLDFSGFSVSISISQLMDILSANPSLTILKLRHLMIDSVGDQSQPTSVLLGNLRVLNLVDNYSDSLRSLLPLINLPASSAELSVGIECPDTMHDQLRDFFIRSEIPVLYWGAGYGASMRESLLRSISSLQTIIIHRFHMEIAQAGEADPPIPPPTSFSRLPSVIMLVCTVNFGGLKALIADHGIQNLRLEKCKTTEDGGNLEDIRASLSQVYPELDCSISDTDSTAKLPCRAMFDDWN